MNTEIKAYSNCDEAIVVWKYNKLIPDCVGFALLRKFNKESDAAAEPVNTWVGFEGQTATPGEHRPSTEWPIQKYIWSDYLVKPGDKVSYKVVPMLLIDDKLVKDEKNATDWSETVEITTEGKYQAYFNRGIISSQFMSRRLSTLKQSDKKATLDSTIKDENSPIRKFLGGVLVEELFGLLDEIRNKKTYTVYAALYELNETFLIEKLKGIGKRVNLILANGAFKSKDDDPNEDARNDLKNKVNLSNRMVAKGHFAHNKFLVVCENGVPIKVWTGSTNWSEHGLYTQVNNGILINDKVVADWYKKEWDLLKEAGNDWNGHPPTLPQDNSTPRKPTVKNINTWFAPVKKFVDLEAAKALIDKAQKGILFLMFNPGTKETLLNYILDMQKEKPDLFIHGIVNQDPGGKKNPLIFYHRGEKQPSNLSIVMPKNIGDEFSYWKEEIKGKMVTIHSKVVILDPFADNSVVMTGSHNLGPKASRANDDNLNLICNQQDLASEYAVNIMSVYNHYRWRYFRNLSESSKKWTGLQSNDQWQKGYLAGSKLKEIDFWMGM